MNWRDTVYWWYFVVHIPITVFIDSTIVVPKEWQLLVSRSIVDFHVSTNHDILLLDAPVWFKVFGAVELLMQLPLFFYCAYHLKRETTRHWPWMVVYGFNAGFTTLVCLVYVIADQGRLTVSQKANLLAVYTPYLVLPFVMMADYIGRINQRLKPKQD